MLTVRLSLTVLSSAEWTALSESRMGDTEKEQLEMEKKEIFCFSTLMLFPSVSLWLCGYPHIR